MKGCRIIGCAYTFCFWFETSLSRSGCFGHFHSQISRGVNNSVCSSARAGPLETAHIFGLVFEKFTGGV